MKPNKAEGWGGGEGRKEGGWTDTKNQILQKENSVKHLSLPLPLSPSLFPPSAHEITDRFVSARSSLSDLSRCLSLSLSLMLRLMLRLGLGLGLRLRLRLRLS